MRSEKLEIHDIFRLSDGTVLIACQKPTYNYDWSNRVALLSSEKENSSVEISILGAAELRSHSKNLDQIALKIDADISLSSKDVREGDWKLLT